MKKWIVLFIVISIISKIFIIYDKEEVDNNVVSNYEKQEEKTKTVNEVENDANTQPDISESNDKEKRFIVVSNNNKKVVYSEKEVEQLKEKENVEVYEDTIVTMVGQQQSWGNQLLKSSESVKVGLTGKGVKVAIIDTGVDINHPDLNVKGGKSFIDGVSSYQDDNGHGTQVAGIIAAQNNNIGVIGISPDVQIYSLKVLDKNGMGYLSDVIEAIEWCINNDIDIVNLSLGTEDNNPLFKEVTNKAYQNGLLLVAAAGNDGNGKPVNYPAKYQSVIGVGAIDESKEIAYYSNTGNEVELVAPGSNILSTTIDGYSVNSGTSMATPFVVGALALYQQETGLSGNSLREKITSTAIDLGKKGKDKIYGYGLIKLPAKQKEQHEEKQENKQNNNQKQEKNENSRLAEQSVEKAEQYRQKLIDNYNVNSFNELVPIDYWVVNEATRLYNEAKSYVNLLPHSDSKVNLYNRLENNVKVHLDRIKLYERALEDAANLYHYESMLKNMYDMKRLDSEVKSVANELSNALRNTNSFEKVYGEKNKRVFIEDYRVPAQNLLEKYSKPLEISNKMDEIQNDIRHNNILMVDTKLRNIRLDIDLLQGQNFYWELDERYNNLVNQYNAKNLQ